MLNHLTPRIQSCSKTKVQNSRQQKSLRYNFIYTFPFLSPDIPQNVELIGEGGIGHRQKIRREGRDPLRGMVAGALRERRICGDPKGSDNFGLKRKNFSGKMSIPHQPRNKKFLANTLDKNRLREKKKSENRGCQL